MKIRSLIYGTAGACALVLAAPQAAGAVTDEQFEALKKMVQQLNEQMQNLAKEHAQDQKTHEQDQQTIRDLQQKVGETQTIATNAAAKAEAAAQVQPIHPVVSGPPATHNFVLAGDAEVQFGKFEGQHSGFTLADFAPIFLFRGGDKVLFEAGFDFILADNAPGDKGYTTTVNLSFATLDYLWNDYVTVVAGNMILPLGTYNERSAGWLNKIPDAPIPRDFLQGTGVGMQLRGAVPIGDSGQMVTYSVYGVNGPGSTNGQIALQQGIDLTSGNVNNPSQHANPSGGGRLGWFYSLKPHTDIELGVSGQSGEWDNNGHKLWSAAVLDAALHVSPYFELRGEYVHTWQETDDVGTIRPKGWWLQGAYKLAGLNLDLPVVNNVEVVGRYDTGDDGLGTTTDRATGGFVYYFSNTLLFEGDYEFVHSSGPAGRSRDPGLILQFSYGF